MRTILAMPACSSGQGVLLFHQRHEIAADAEEAPARGEEHRPHLVPLAQLGDAVAELAAKLAVNRISAVGLVQDDMSKTIVDRAFEALRGDGQSHRRLPSLVQDGSRSWARGQA